MSRPDRWLVVTVESPSDEITPILAEGLVASGGGAVIEEGATLRTWVAPESGDAARFIARLEASLAALAGQPVPIRWEWHADEDWTETWKRGIAARRIGERLVVAPSWIEPDARAGDVVIVIDPEMAFGTGEHATTRGALRLLQHALDPGARVLDVGSGSGILAIAAARLGADRADAVECDPEAMPYLASNAARNGVADRVRVEQALVDAGYLARRAARYDVILANVLSGVLRPLLGHLRAALRPGGSLILGGILQTEAESMVAAATAAGLHVVEEDREDEWWTALLRSSGGRTVEPAS